ncbi:BON domain-containing protein [Flavobacterium terrigena]|uniref:BON domain-containing protein n=1 Tax=Flavobacterium terrigena TaxID=402734 RepID=A0A1H6Q7V6_9FLAO|nr:BON domain-containing protein [Flavobacterium terrigena]SEI39881.1 BON domain-containing protein [Flavobacterium terrigena]
MNSNTTLKERIEKNLERSYFANNIIIDVIDDEVTLKGTVGSYEVKDKIEQIVLNFSEVQAVNNELAIYNEN